MEISVTPGVTGPHFMQAAFVVEDIEAAARQWARVAGVGPFLLLPHLTIGEMRYRGQPMDDLDFSVAIAQSGGIQIELIEQHNDRPSQYRDLIPKGGQGFHHFCVFSDDYDAALAHYRALGFELALDAVNDGVRFCYVDTSPALGCMIELVEKSDFWSGLFGQVAQAAATWDGQSDPVRTQLQEKCL